MCWCGGGGVAAHGMVLPVAIYFCEIWHFKKALCVQCCGVSVWLANADGGYGDGGGDCDDGADGCGGGGGEFCLGGCEGCVGIGCVSCVMVIIKKKE